MTLISRQRMMVKTILIGIGMSIPFVIILLGQNTCGNPEPLEPAGSLHTTVARCDAQAEAITTTGVEVDSGWLDLFAAPSSAGIIIQSGGCGEVSEACSAGMAVNGSLKVGGATCDAVISATSVTGQELDAGQLDLCSNGDVVLTIAEDDCGQFTEQCPPTMAEVGRFRVGGTCDGTVRATSSTDRTISSGWMSICAGADRAEFNVAYDECRSGPARAYSIEDVSDLPPGEVTSGKTGDIMLANDYIKAVIQAPGRDIQWGVFGGTIIDIARVLPDGSSTEDTLGEISLFFNCGHSLNATEVYVLDDGSTTGEAMVVAEGEEDLFDIIKLDAALEPYGVQIPYDLNEDFPLYIRTTYTLGSSDRHIHIATEFINYGDEDIVTEIGDLIESGGDVEPYLPNPQKETISGPSEDGENTYTWGGFGESEYALLDFMGFRGAQTSYGYVAPRLPNGNFNAIAVTISGVTVTALETDSILDVFSGNPQGLPTIPANGSLTVERDFVIGSDVGIVSDAAYQLRGDTTGTVRGQVLEASTDVPLAHVRIGVVQNSDLEAPVTALNTDDNGRFEVTLPPGTYGLVAIEGHDFADVGRPWSNTPVDVSVDAGALIEQNIYLGSTGYVTITVRSGNPPDSALVPARVAFYADMLSPPKAVMDVTSDFLGSGIARLSWLTDGEDTFKVAPGTYDVLVTRGFEYDTFWMRDVVVSNSTEPVRMDAILTRVLDTDGYISADLHVHGIRSPDSTVTLADRVRTFLGEGVEVLVSTDHDTIADYRPTIDELGVSPWLTTLIGVESTSFNMGHFNMFPLQIDVESRSGGAIDWADADYLPIDPTTGEPVEVGAPVGYPSGQDNLSAYQIAMAYEKAFSGTQVRQINHGRGDLGGHFTQLGLDLSQYGTASETSASPSDFRLPDGTDLFAPEGMTAMEIQNGTSISSAVTLMNDWFGLLNLGVILAGTCDSDTHERISSKAGYSRTFVSVDVDNVASMHNDPEFPEEFARSINSLNISCGTGLFMNSSASNSAGSSVPQGGLLSADGEVMLMTRIQAPASVTSVTVEIFVNTEVTANIDDVLELNTTADLNPDYTLRSNEQFSWQSITIDTSNPNGAQRFEGSVELALELTEDSWIVVTATGASGQLVDYLNRNVEPFGFTNPIFVDFDGDGAFDAPGSTYVHRQPTTSATKKTKNARK